MYGTCILRGITDLTLGAMKHGRFSKRIIYLRCMGDPFPFSHRQTISVQLTLDAVSAAQLSDPEEASLNPVTTVDRHISPTERLSAL